jgi:DNA repair photolyase
MARGAQSNPANRYLPTSLYLDTDGDGLDEPLGEELAKTRFIETPAKSILSKVTSPDLPMAWSLNPYQGCEHGCIYCYARNTHEYYGYSAGLDFEQTILVRTNAAQLLEKALSNPNWEVESISLSGNTDCYQPCERTYRLTRSVLETALRFGQPVSIITKNALIGRDESIIAALAAEGLVHVYFSITTLSEPLRRLLEPRTATAVQKLKLIERFTAAGIPCGIMNAPIIPGLNDHEAPAVVAAAAAAGALSAGYTFVRLNGPIGPLFTTWIETHFPDRAAKVLHQISEAHGGGLNDSQFGRRMRGEGPVADMVSALHRQAVKRYMPGRSMPPYNKNAFRRGGQLSLF